MDFHVSRGFMQMILVTVCDGSYQNYYQSMYGERLPAKSGEVPA